MFTKKDYFLRLLIRQLAIASLICFSFNSYSYAKPSSTDNLLSMHWPKYFEQNAGQFNPVFPFIARSNDVLFGFHLNGVDIQLNSQKVSSSNLQLRFLNGGKAKKITGGDKLPNVVNYIRGSSTQWIKGISTFTDIQFHSIYPDIDIRFYFNSEQLEYDFIVAPGADPERILINYPQADSIQILQNGDLKIKKDDKDFIQKAPVIYQTVNKQNQVVKGKYLKTANGIKFKIESYDKDIALIIDPVIEFSSYFGGEWEDLSNAIRSDSAGNIYIAGSSAARARVTSQNILTLENTPVGIQKNNETHFFQSLHGIQLDENYKNGDQLDLVNNTKTSLVNGQITVDSFTYECDYQYSGFFGNDKLITDYDGFISKFNSNYQLLYTTYFGGCRNDGIRDMAIDGNDNVYIAGFTLSKDFPTKSASQNDLAASRFDSEPVQADAFYAKFDSEGDLIYSSYLGGNGRDGARGITVDADENLYITGYTHSNNLITHPCPIAGKSVIGCDSIGGVDETANTTGSTDLSLYSDAFVARISPFGDVIGFLTYFGGRYDDWGQSIRVYNEGIYVTGNTSSPDLLTNQNNVFNFMPYNANLSENGDVILCSRINQPDTVGAVPPDAHFCEDVFLTKLSLDASTIEFTTYLGGIKDDNVSQLEIDDQGNIYLVGVTKSQGHRMPTALRSEISSANTTLLQRFPLYKNINQYEFDSNSTSNNAFLTVFNPNAESLILSSFIMGNDDDVANGLAISSTRTIISDGITDELIDVYVAGHTRSKNFYTINGFQNGLVDTDIFLTKFTLNMRLKNESITTACTILECNLYEIKYSSLIGGEGLDSVKDLFYNQFLDKLYLSGVSYSTRFPLTNNAVKKQIDAVLEKNFVAGTSILADQYIYYPSDIILMVLNNNVEQTDLTIAINVKNNGRITPGGFIEFEYVIQNISASVTASNVSLAVNYPYLSSKEDLKDNLVSSGGDCQIEETSIYCMIGTLASGQQYSGTLSLKTRNSGLFETIFSVFSMTTDLNMDNNQLLIKTNVNDSDSSRLDYVFLVSMIFLLLIFRKFKASSFDQ